MQPDPFLVGHAPCVLRTLPDGCVDCCVTSPPYWGLRDYKIAPTAWPEVTFVPVAGLPPITVSAMECCLGLEADPWAFVAHLVHVFREVRRVLKARGTVWLNLGDSYAGSWGAQSRGNITGESKSTLTGRSPLLARQMAGAVVGCAGKGSLRDLEGLKAKDLIGIPWRVAFALQADGWYLRSDVIWSKPNPMPESVKDRPTKAHEYLFLLTASDQYHYDADAIREPASTTRPDLLVFGDRPDVGFPGHMQGRRRASKKRGEFHGKTGDAAFRAVTETRNARSVWEIATKGFPGAHFATFPEELPRRCILAGCPPQGTVLDLFGGSGTTSAVAKALGRGFVYIDQSERYAEMARKRVAGVTPPLEFGEVANAS